MLLKRKVTITQIATTMSDTFFYTVGLGSDGKVYLWDKLKAAWVPHTVTQAEIDDAVRQRAAAGQ